MKPAATCLCLLMALSLSAAQKELPGHVPAQAKASALVAGLPATQTLSLSLGLPLRDPAGADALLAQINDPKSDQFRHYLTPAEFTARFGPTEAQYAAVVAFAKKSGLIIAATHPNRLLLDVAGPAATVEKAFQVKLSTFQHPTEARHFYAPDKNPLIDAVLPIQEIQGLSDFSKPKPAGLRPNAAVKPMGGSGPGGTFMGNDFRKAYAPGVTLTGTGQVVALVEFDGYSPSDIASYYSRAGITAVPLQNVLVGGYSGAAGGNNAEVCLDIEMAAAMAPGLSKIMVYESQGVVSILNQIANDNAARQISCSWTWGSQSATVDQIFKQMALQGQSFFTASGDSGAYTGGVDAPADNPYAISVGGTTLTTTSSGAWSSETTWNWGGSATAITGSSGGVSTYYLIPAWQKLVNTAQNGGSTTMRNVPDVALTADNIYVTYDNGAAGGFGGTSCATPLWAAFNALINQQLAAAGKSPVGLINPLVYALASTNYTGLHDITTGNNLKYNAGAGYDLCTGLGTPLGQLTINQLSGSNPPITNGGVQVVLSPTNVLSAARWSLDGAGSYASGATVTASVGQHTLAFSAVSGYTTPASQSLTVTNAVTTVRTAAYSPLASGTVSVTIAPAAAASAGARWSLDGTGSYTSGTAVSAAAGQHTITFAAATNWIAPGATVITVAARTTNAVTGTYQGQPTLTVTLAPGAVTNLGGFWMVDGGLPRPSGVKVTLSVGAHLVTFSPVAGYATPASASVTLVANQAASLTATYTSGKITVQLVPATIGGTWQIDGGSPHPGGTALTVAAGSHVVSFNGVQGYTAPASQTVTVTASGATSVTGTYTPLPTYYSGLFYNLTQPAMTNTGFITVTLNSTQASISAQIGTNVTTVTGTVSNNVISAPALKLSGVVSTDKKTITGSLGTASLIVYLNGAYTSTNPAPNAGYYTIAFPGSTNTGYGYGYANVSAGGQATVSVVLPDNTSAYVLNAVNVNSQIPFYFPVLGGKGAFYGWLGFTNTATLDLAGYGCWSYPTTTNTYFNLTGFTNLQPVIGNRYTTNLCAAFAGSHTLTLASPVNPFAVAAPVQLKNNLTLQSGTNTVSLSLNPAYGYFTGAAASGGNGAGFGGVILPKLQRAYGYFIGRGYTGNLTVQ